MSLSLHFYIFHSCTLKRSSNNTKVKLDYIESFVLSFPLSDLGDMIPDVHLNLLEQYGRDVSFYSFMAEVFYLLVLFDFFQQFFFSYFYSIGILRYYRENLSVVYTVHQILLNYFHVAYMKVP